MSQPSQKSLRDSPLADGGPRDLATVPYIEMRGGRLQGVVSSGSDIARVYCVFIEAGTLAYYSSTNNDRPDAGTGKRIGWLIDAAVAQWGLPRVIAFLGLTLDPTQVKHNGELTNEIARKGPLRKEPAGVVFSRFLHYLRFVERAATDEPLPEMAWFHG